MKFFVRRLPWFVAGAVLLGLLVYGFYPQPVPVEVVSPVRGSLEVTVDDDGETRIRERYLVVSPVDGDMQRVELEPGDPVVCNQTMLVQIEPGEPALLDARVRAEAEMRVLAKSAGVEQADAAVSRAKEVLELAEHDYTRAREAIAGNSISRAEYDEAEHRQRVAGAELRAAEFARRVAGFELDLANVALRQFQRSPDAEPQPPLDIVSPIDGLVLNVHREDAGYVSAGTPLIEIGDPRDMEITVDVLSMDAVGMRPGNKVWIEHWGGEQPLLGLVRRVEPAAFLKISALGVEEKRVKVIADFVDPWTKRQTLGDGYRVEARIVVSTTAADSLKIPAGALFREQSQWCVFRVADGSAQLTHVTVGSSNGAETEILSGLTPEDQVILHPTDKVKTGVRVQLHRSTMPP
jgi:HlyD family secretion protein